MTKYEQCARCGYDHDYEHTQAQKAHAECIICTIELNGLGIGNGSDHTCQDNVAEADEE